MAAMASTSENPASSSRRESRARSLCARREDEGAILIGFGSLQGLLKRLSAIRGKRNGRPLEGPPVSELRYRWIYQLGPETPLASVPRQSPPEATAALP